MKRPTQLTPEETFHMLGAISVADTVDEAAIFVRLHARLDAVKGERGQRRQHT